MAGGAGRPRRLRRDHEIPGPRRQLRREVHRRLRAAGTAALAPALAAPLRRLSGSVLRPVRRGYAPRPAALPRGGPAGSGRPSPVSATSPGTLPEATPNGATVTVALGGATFAGGVSASSSAPRQIFFSTKFNTFKQL